MTKARLDGRVAIVTGTSPNIGGGLAEGLAAAGAAIVCVDIKPENTSNCAEYLNAKGYPALGIACDVTDETQVEDTVTRSIAQFGHVDILVNNAVMFKQKGVLDMALAEWQQQLSVILDGTFLFTKYVAQSMIEANRQGSIINIISTAGHQGQPGNVGYCTGKAGLLNFTRSAAMELARYGIRVNSLTPTATAPNEGFAMAEAWGRPSSDTSKIEAVMDDFRQGVPLQRLPGPSDYAAAAVFLASDDARMMTGTDIQVDAGALARYWAWNPTDNN